jgi:primosomal protein N' (replication factor Y)
MIAKGLDFPNVRLVGVVSADTALTLPDFRSGERTFQLVSQVAGRAGRGEHLGRVLVQTMEPANPAIVLAARHDYRGFAAVELASRARSGLPPATRMARIICRDESAPAARESAARIAELLRSGATRGTRVIGPIQCPLGRAHGQFRFAAEVIAPGAVELHACLAAVRAEGLLVSDAKTAVDVDPVSLM